MSSLGIIERVQDTLIDLLKEAFSYNTDYPYVDDLDLTSINFYRSYPKVVPSYAIVIIEPPSISNMVRSLGDDLFEEIRGSLVIDGVTVANGLCFQVYGGVYTAGLTLSISARTSAEREKILDWIITYLRHEYRYYLEDEAIDIIDISREPESVEVYGADLIYMSNIRVTFFTEWERIKLVDSSLIIKGMDISINSIIPDGSTVAEINTSL
jgi:hypothetical protein